MRCTTLVQVVTLWLHIVISELNFLPQECGIGDMPHLHQLLLRIVHIFRELPSGKVVRVHE